MAIAVVLFEAVWVVAIVPDGKVGVPVNVGLAKFAFRLSAVVTNAVVAICVVFVPGLAVGASGVPVSNPAILRSLMSRLPRGSIDATRVSLLFLNSARLADPAPTALKVGASSMTLKSGGESFLMCPMDEYYPLPCWPSSQIAYSSSVIDQTASSIGSILISKISNNINNSRTTCTTCC